MYKISIFEKKLNMRIGILTAGGDCPGINAAIRGVAKTAIFRYKMEVVGISDGFTGLINNDYKILKEADVSNILTLGGTILGTSREKPYKKTTDFVNDKPEKIKKNYYSMGLDCLVCIGGNGTMRTAAKLASEGLNIIGIPKTIDNDVWGTETTFGFDSAVQIATDAIDRLHTTANSHKRVMIIELMGHNAGWITLYAGIAGGGDVILIPEIKFDIDIVCKYLLDRVKNKKSYSIVVVGEGIEKPENISAGRYISNLIEEKTGLETRETVLGYIQRGGTPSHTDRILATRYGAHAANLIAKQKFGRMVALKKNKIGSLPLEEVGGKVKLVEPELPLLKKARYIGTCFGDAI